MIATKAIFNSDAHSGVGNASDIWRYVKTLAISFMMFFSYAVTASAAALDEEEVQYASYVVLCLDHVKTHGGELEFWEAEHESVEDAYLDQAGKNLAAVKKSMSSIDRGLIARRCAEFKTAVIDPDSYEEPSAETQKLAEAAQENVGRLADAMKVAGFSPDDLNDVLGFLIQLSNRIENRHEVAELTNMFLESAITGLEAQRAASVTYKSKKKRVSSLMGLSEKTLGLCHKSARFDSMSYLEKGQYEPAREAMVKGLLWESLGFYRKGLGGSPYLPNASEKEALAPLDASWKKVQAYQKLEAKDRVLLIGTGVVCAQAISGKKHSKSVSKLIFEPLKASNRVSEREASN